MRHVLLSLGILLILTVSSITAQVPRRSFLFKDARGELAQARERGEIDVLLVIASMPDQNEQVAQAIAGLGGTVQFQADEVDYIRARVPVEAVEQLVSHSAVHSVDISITGSRAFGMAAAAPVLPNSEDFLVSGILSEAVNPDTIIWPPVLSDYPITNRYSPLFDIRASEFLDSNPTYDGRGVKIAMIDMNPDPLLPELQVATDLDGQPIRKIGVYGTAQDLEDEDDGRWIRMEDMVTAADGQFTYGDNTYVAPKDGTFRIALFSEARDSLATFGGSLENDVNRDGNPEGSSRLFGVLWDEETDDVWVDTNQDLSFADQTALTDYNDRPEFGVFGTDDPDTPIRESVAFGIQIAQEEKLIALNLGSASHATLVVGAALANRGSEGRFDGVAPGAQLISIAEGGSAYGQIESPLISIRDHGAEVVYFEQSSNITRNYLLRDGRLVPTVIYERLIDRYDPVILSPTHNYPILGGIDDFVMARGLIGINGHESKENFFINHGVRVEHDDNLLITGGYGPMGNGALKPDVISPSNYVSTALGFIEGRAIPGLYQLPPGYTIAGGTSTATPTAAGAVALLLSAAKQEGISYDAHRIKYAVTRGARWVPHLKPHKPGNGVISVAGAWDILKKLDEGGEMVSIVGQAPVKHSYSHLLATPNEGEGLYERDGWNVGDSEERTITLTRTSGPNAPMTFSVSWAGNEAGTFSAPSTVTLPLNRPVPVSITVNPNVQGAHTAHFTLDHSSIPGYAYRMLFTVVAPESLDVSNDYHVQSSIEVPRPGIQSFFYRVPEGAESLVVDLGWQEREVSMSISRPDTRAVRGDIVQAGQGVKQVINNPIPGVWEVRLSDVADTRTFDWEQAKKKEPVPPTEATLTVTAIAAEVSVMRQETAGQETGSATHDLWVTNRMGVFTGRLMSNPLGSARRLQLELAEKEQRIFEVEVPPGSPALMARVFDSSNPDADADLYVFDCTGEECTPARTDADPEGDESVIIWNPSAGQWKIVVDAVNQPAETVTYEYLDAVFNSSFGNVAVLDVPQERGQDSRWMAKAHVWSAGSGSHEPGRIPYPAVLLEGWEGSQSFPMGILELARD